VSDRIVILLTLLGAKARTDSGTLAMFTAILRA
jgi:hypothetical protein